MDLLVLNAPAAHLWLAGRLEGDGLATPRIEQMQLDVDHEPLTAQLPAVYREPPGAAVMTLDHLLDLYESMLGDSDGLVASLAARLDPWATPDAARPVSWLDWLAGWLALDLDETWTLGVRRAAVADAFRSQAGRGTAGGLIGAVQRAVDATVTIVEPALTASVWSLGGRSELGFTSMLAVVQPQGAVLDTTTVLDESSLLDDEGPDPSVFADLAGIACVRVNRSDVPTAADEARLREVVAREAPAHLRVGVAVVEPEFLIGMQDRIGIDAIVGVGPRPAALTGPNDDRATRLGVDSVLADGALPSDSTLPTASVGQLTIR
jgi:phage tail-like protein